MNLTPKHYHQRSKHHKEQATQISYHLDVFSSVILEGVNEKPAKAGPCTFILSVVTQYDTSLRNGYSFIITRVKESCVTLCCC